MSSEISHISYQTQFNIAEDLRSTVYESIRSLMDNPDTDSFASIEFTFTISRLAPVALTLALVNNTPTPICGWYEPVISKVTSSIKFDQTFIPSFKVIFDNLASRISRLTSTIKCNQTLIPVFKEIFDNLGSIIAADPYTKFQSINFDVQAFTKEMTPITSRSRLAYLPKDC